MESNNLIKRLGTHAKNLGRLSVSILEHYVQELTGEKAIEILQEPYEREKRLLLLVDALSKTESEIKNGNLLLGKYLDVQLKNSSDLMQAMISFQDDIDFSSLTEKLTAEFKIAFSEEPEADLNKNAQMYASILRKKVVSVSDETIVGRITAATLLDIREFLSQQIRGSDTDARQLELLQKMVELLQQLINQPYVGLGVKHKQKNHETFETKDVSSLPDIQSAMRACKTIPNRLEALFENLRISGFIRGDLPPDNINRLTVGLYNRPDKMIRFLDDLKETESSDYGQTFSSEFIELLSIWAKFPKEEEIQKSYINWLNKLLSRMISPEQIFIIAPIAGAK